MKAKGGLSSWRNKEVFISWSGMRSRIIAEGFRDFLPKVLGNVSPWVSSKDIESGVRWADELGAKLKRINCGIVCVTPDNAASPWLHFEAGAISNYLDSNLVCTFLLEIREADLTGPLVQFQASRADREGTLKVIRALNSSKVGAGRAEVDLDDDFAEHWPGFAAELERAKAFSEAKVEKRPTEEMVGELLTLVRDQSRTLKEFQKRALNIDNEIAHFEGAVSEVIHAGGSEEEKAACLGSLTFTEWEKEKSRVSAYLSSLQGRHEVLLNSEDRDPYECYNLGLEHWGAKECRLALNMFDLSIELCPDEAFFYIARSSLQSCCDDPEVRDGCRSLADAKKAIQISEKKGAFNDARIQFRYLQVYAASYAEAGLLREAVDIQAKALMVSAESDRIPGSQRQTAEGRADIYSGGKALRGRNPFGLLHWKIGK